MSKVRIGIVCEGSTDAVVIQAICEQFLAEHGWQAHVFPIQPVRDNTQGEQGGWTMVRDWIVASSHQVRCERYLGLGLFANGLDAFQCDFIFIHLDSDIISDPAFNLGKPPATRNPIGDRKYVQLQLETWLDYNSLSKIDQIRYILGVSVQSTETWCVALFDPVITSVEELTGEFLAKTFNKALLSSESRPNESVEGVANKDRKRRMRFAKKQITTTSLRRAMTKSPSLKIAMDNLGASTASLVPVP
jgi:hypothetical protein